MPPSPPPDRSPAPFIQIRGLHKAFNSQKVLQGIDLDIQLGETLVLIGPSGEGKSVLLKHIIGLLCPDAGTIHFDGVALCGLKERQFTPFRRRMGYLFQSSALFDSFTVAENVAFPLLESGMKDRAEIQKRVDEALEVVELDEHADKMPINLSGGMRKRVGIARAIVGRPEIILYDEPTAGLDPIVTDIIDHLIKRLQNRYGVTSVVITHDMTSVFKIADRIAMLKSGRVAFCGTPDELRASTDTFIQDFIIGRSGMTS
jgi:phospholipid/cholesterol/gamma-HCH transport system ATP-binding protein